MELKDSGSIIKGYPAEDPKRLNMHIRNALHILKHGKNEEDSRIQFVPGLGSLPLLRVLDLSGVMFEGAKLHSSIGELIHLRLLNLYEAWVCHLPSSLRNLKRLLYLTLFVNYLGPVHVPNVLKEMLELSCTSETISSSLREMTYFETFALFDWQEIRLADHGGEVVLDFIHPKNLVLTCGFPQLCDLVLAEQMELEEWRVEEGSMPCLRTLTAKSWSFRMKEKLVAGIRTEARLAPRLEAGSLSGRPNPTLNVFPGGPRGPDENLGGQRESNCGHHIGITPSSTTSPTHVG
ncbi:predicted protein [Arabidopsis lyrata subsp. lyrata]|uniref:Predicted protein n=1 Tax=Arabidopsis lyrata subsp. lyrata TaxID=81972 RepID=D7L817_ARALL|nr:predicted protein [Arabidopsis lyrata subsp. lyrata]